jgi:hypothetical protein
MRVKIGNYTNWMGPYQIAEKLLFWLDKHEDKRVHKFGTWLAGGEDKDSLLMRACTWIHSKQKRQIVVKLDRWDTWNMDATLAIIILPMLKQLKATQHGAGFVDDADVPEGIGLWSDEADPKENEFDTDSNHFKRWEWVLDEMIWAFEQKQPDYDWEDQYHSGKIDMTWKPIGELDAEGDAKMYEMEKGPLDTHQFDTEGHKQHQARITNALKLFGKYYQNLWD